MAELLRLPDGSAYGMADSNGIFRAIPINTTDLRLFMPLHHRGLLSGSTFKDASRFANHGTISGALWTPTGISLDGLDDYLSVPDHPSLDYTTTTYMAWVKISSTGATSPYARILLTKGASAEPEGHRLGLSYVHHATVGSRDLRFTADTDGIAAIYVVNLSDDIWHFISGTHNGTPRLYLDGKLVKTGSADTWTPNDQPVCIGGGRANRYSNVSIGEVLIYSRVLTPVEIMTHYQQTKGFYQ